MEHDQADPLSPPPHRPRQAPGSGVSLNSAVRQELWYLDTVLSMPFRTVRRLWQGTSAAWTDSAAETLWAMENMVRLPIWVLQAAFGEPLGAEPEPPPAPSNADPDQTSRSA
jgi:hypothetical protein